MNDAEKEFNHWMQHNYAKEYDYGHTDDWAKAAWVQAWHTRDAEVAALNEQVLELQSRNDSQSETIQSMFDEIDKQGTQVKALREYAQNEEERFMTHRWCEDCTTLGVDVWAYCPAHRVLGRLVSERRVALALSRAAK